MILLQITRLLLLGTLWILMSFLIVPICLLFPFRWPASWLYSRLTCPLTCKILGLHIKVSGTQNLKAHPIIIICNHQHALDVPICGTFFPTHCVCLGKKELFYIPFFGQIFWLAGNLLIHRYHRKRAMRSMNQTKHLLLHKKTSIWIMPEGTRNPKGELLPFKKGAFHVAVQTGIPLVPVTISSYAKDFSLDRWQSKDVLVEILPPISTKELKEEDIPLLVEQSWKKMKDSIDRLNTHLKNSDF